MRSRRVIILCLAAVMILSGSVWAAVTPHQKVMARRAAELLNSIFDRIKMQQVLVGMIRQYYGSHAEARRDENLRSGSMAAQTLMLAAKALGYDSCPMIGFDFEAAAELLHQFLDKFLRQFHDAARHIDHFFSLFS